MENIRRIVRENVLIRIAERCIVEIQKDLGMPQLIPDEEVDQVVEKCEIVLTTLEKLERSRGKDHVVQRISKALDELISKLEVIMNSS